MASPTRPATVCIEVVQDKVVMVGDVAMNRRIANMDEGSYLGSLKTMAALTYPTQAQLWVPGHGDALGHPAGRAKRVV
ncbi:MAG: hypothetical protein U5L74_11520 [Ideonella sp.]|nr:hypothetical protein [Ideonella sp.]